MFILVSRCFVFELVLFIPFLPSLFIHFDTSTLTSTRRDAVFQKLVWLYQLELSMLFWVNFG